jgi:hypothetical protein
MTLLGSEIAITATLAISATMILRDMTLLPGIRAKSKFHLFGWFATGARWWVFDNDQIAFELPLDASSFREPLTLWAVCRPSSTKAPAPTIIVQPPSEWSST